MKKYVVTHKTGDSKRVSPAYEYILEAKSTFFASGKYDLIEMVEKVDGEEEGNIIMMAAFKGDEFHDNLFFLEKDGKKFYAKDFTEFHDLCIDKYQDVFYGDLNKMWQLMMTSTIRGCEAIMSGIEGEMRRAPTEKDYDSWKEKPKNNSLLNRVFDKIKKKLS